MFFLCSVRVHLSTMMLRTALGSLRVAAHTTGTCTARRQPRQQYHWQWSRHAQAPHCAASVRAVTTTSSSQQDEGDAVQRGQERLVLEAAAALPVHVPWGQLHKLAGREHGQQRRAIHSSVALSEAAKVGHLPACLYLCVCTSVCLCLSACPPLRDKPRPSPNPMMTAPCE